jgi:cytidylate kinase
MRITISGTPGSGKTSVAKILAKQLGLVHYSIGDLRGKMALEREINIDELNKLGEQEDFTDKEADKYQQKLGKKEDNFVIDGRLSYHFIPSSVKIFLDVNLDTGCRRIMKDKRADEKSFETVEKTKQHIKNRIKSDDYRYKKYYNIDYKDKTQYDLIIDTSEMIVEEVANAIIKYLKRGKNL